VERLDLPNKDTGEWREAIIEDRRTPVSEQVAFRCDFPAWLGQLSCRNRRIAESLAVGYGTSEVAKRFNVTSARVSELRRELHKSWSSFQGEPEIAAHAAA
jgi:hypothetical protein